MRPPIGVKPEFEDRLERCFPRDGRRGRPRRPSLRSVVCGYYARAFRAQGLTSSEIRGWLPHVLASFDQSPRQPPSEDELKGYDRALQRLEDAEHALLPCDDAASLRDGRMRVAGRAAHYHSEQARSAHKATHDRLLRELDFEAAWDNCDFLRARREYGRLSIDALEKQAACAGQHTETFDTQVERWREDVARVEARLSELQKEEGLRLLDGLTTPELRGFSKAAYDRLVRLFDPALEDATATSASDVLRRLPLHHEDL